MSAHVWGSKTFQPQTVARAKQCLLAAAYGASPDVQDGPLADIIRDAQGWL